MMKQNMYIEVLVVIMVVAVCLRRKASASDDPANADPSCRPDRFFGAGCEVATSSSKIYASIYLLLHHRSFSTLKPALSLPRLLLKLLVQLKVSSV